MKKIIAYLMLLLVAFTLVSCNSVKPTEKVGILDKVASVSLVKNPELSGEIFAKGIYTGYILTKKDGKHEKEVKMLENLYFELLQAEKADERPTLAAVNRAGLTVLRAAMVAKYGYVKGGLIADAVQIGGGIIDARIKKKLSETDEEKFMTSFIATLKECVANTPVIEKEIEEECVDCDICERIKRELARDDLTDEERAEYEKMLKQYECGDVGFCGKTSE